MRAGDRIEKTIKVDDTTKATTRGKFARVCVELDLRKPLKTGYRMRGREWKLKYEGLQEFRFSCGHYGHRESNCQAKTKSSSSSMPNARVFTGEGNEEAKGSKGSAVTT